MTHTIKKLFLGLVFLGAGSLPDLAHASDSENTLDFMYSTSPSDNGGRFFHIWGQHPSEEDQLTLVNPQQHESPRQSRQFFSLSPTELKGLQEPSTDSDVERVLSEHGGVFCKEGLTSNSSTGLAENFNPNICPVMENLGSALSAQKTQSLPGMVEEDAQTPFLASLPSKAKQTSPEKSKKSRALVINFEDVLEDLNDQNSSKTLYVFSSSSLVMKEMEIRDPISGHMSPFHNKPLKIGLWDGWKRMATQLSQGYNVPWISETILLEEFLDFLKHFTVSDLVDVPTYPDLKDLLTKQKEKKNYSVVASVNPAMNSQVFREIENSLGFTFCKQWKDVRFGEKDFSGLLMAEREGTIGKVNLVKEFLTQCKIKFRTVVFVDDLKNTFDRITETWGNQEEELILACFNPFWKQLDQDESKIMEYYMTFHDVKILSNAAQKVFADRDRRLVSLQPLRVRKLLEKGLSFILDQLNENDKGKDDVKKRLAEDYKKLLEETKLVFEEGMQSFHKGDADQAQESFRKCQLLFRTLAFINVEQNKAAPEEDKDFSLREILLKIAKEITTEDSLQCLYQNVVVGDRTTDQTLLTGLSVLQKIEKKQKEVA